MALSMTYNGVDLSGTSYGVTVVRGPIPFAGESELYYANVPGRHGGMSNGTAYYEPRTIEAVLNVRGTSWSNLQTRLDNLAYAMRPELGNVAIIFDERNDRRWVGQFTGDIDPTPIGNGAVQFTARFLCATAIAEAATATTQNVTIDASPDAVTVPAAGTVAGTTHALPVWTFRNTDSTTITTFTVANSTTNETLTVNYSIPQNAYVRIDTARELIEYSTDGTNWTVIMTARSDINKSFPRLAPRVSNSCSITGFVAGTLALTYRARFLR